MVLIRETLARGMTELDYSRQDIFGMRLAMEEAVVSSIKHGHHANPTQEVAIRYFIGLEFVLVDVKDHGPGFDPSQVPDPTTPQNLERPGGRGLLLIQNYTSWVCFNERGNCITLCKYPSKPLARTPIKKQIPVAE